VSNQLNRKILKVNQRKSITQQFQYVEPTFKAHTRPSVFAWANRGRGVQGETVNSQNQAGKFIVNKNWKPV
jgi:hypothetical protein